MNEHSGAAAEHGRGADDGDGDGDGDDRSSAEVEADVEAFHVLEYPRFPELPEGREAEVAQQSKAIKEGYQNMRGRFTYGFAWKKYDEWHRIKFGVDAPRCPHTGFIWLNLRQGTDCVRHMGQTDSNTASQVRAFTSIAADAVTSLHFHPPHDD